MTVDPKSQDEVESDIETGLRGRIAQLTNFLDSSFNSTWISAFSSSIHDLEARLLAAQFAGWVNYAGSEIDQTDLDQLGVDGVTPEEVNEHMQDQHLDELGALVGVERDEGSRATGDVTIQTATDSTRVPEGMKVSTTFDEDGDRLTFLVDADGDGEIGDTGFVTPSSGQTEVTVDVIAEDIGSEYNVGAGAINRFPNPPIGVEGVTNNVETTGGENVQSNESYRDDITNAVFESSGGGTTAGIRGYIEQNVTGVTDVAIEEFASEQPPRVDVIVDEGSDSAAETAIDESRPAGIQHDLVRPETISLGVDAELVGSDIDQSFVEDQITSYLTSLSLDEEFRRSVLTQRILNADDDIEDIGSMTVLLLSADREGHVYQTGTDIYELDFAPLGNVTEEQFLYDDGTDVYSLEYEQINDSSVTVTAVVDGERTTLTNDTDYDVVDTNSDSNLDGLDFSIGGDSPDNRTVVEVEYTHESWTIDSEIEDDSGDTYQQGTDWQLIDDNSDSRQDSIDWSIGGSTPDDSELFTVSYEAKRDVPDDLATSQREKVGAGSRIETDTFPSINLT
jgi:hypothetical protein